MASQHIDITGAESRMAGKLRAAIDGVRGTVDQVDRLKDTFDQIASGGDWTALGAALGGMNTTDAQTVYNLLGSAKAALDDAAVAAFTDRLG